MEVKSTGGKTIKWMRISLCTCFLLLSAILLCAQPSHGYMIKNGRMYVQITKDLRTSALDSFIRQFQLEDLDLKTFLKTNKPDSLIKRGWHVEENNETGIIISKAFEPFKNPDNKISFKELMTPLFPAVDNKVLYGVNWFRNKAPFDTKGSVVRFFLRNHTKARQVMLAGSFNKWNPDQLFMKKTDSGWIFDVKLDPGKYWYKFIADGNWMIDTDNLLSENDGEGNINSVFFKTNTVFTLNGFQNAKKVFLAGSFNNWKPDQLLMKKTSFGWQLPLYLAEGTHTYKFVADGSWYADEKNPEKLPDGQGDFNSVLRIGKPYLFKLNGFANARQVILTGSFNGWREDELLMHKTVNGWELPYTLGPGNYEYKFKVDGRWMSDPANKMTSAESGNSFLIIHPNYTFRLKGFKDAKQVFLAGDFNNWDPKAYAMKREGDGWVFTVHLSPGKHLYKFIVDDKWIIDPANKLWEQNEYGTGNSVIWMEQ